jgi:ABC-type antimicrobial peptide transport system permease subunit
MIIQGPAPHNWFGTLTFRFNEKNKRSANLKTIEQIFRKYNPNYPFQYYFVDESYAQRFRGTQITASLSSLFAGLCIFISCLGLFALAAYMAENRTKEIGIRKVLGASVTTITTLLSKDFVILVIIAFAIASPLAWWAMNAWLQDFSYRISISWWIFAVTGVVSVLIALGTVSFQAIKAALANPVKSLRTE